MHANETGSQGEKETLSTMLPMYHGPYKIQLLTVLRWPLHVLGTPLIALQSRPFPFVEFLEELLLKAIATVYTIPPITRPDTEAIWRWWRAFIFWFAGPFRFVSLGAQISEQNSGSACNYKLLRKPQRGHSTVPRLFDVR